MEIIQDEAERILRKLNTAELRVIGEFLKVPKESIEGKSKSEVLREIQANLDAVEEDYQRTGILQALPIPPMHKKAYEKLFAESNEAPKAPIKVEVDSKPKSFDIEYFKRDFKISGIIADGTPKALNYINLCSQINDGKKKGYSETEIVAAIKKSISPGTGLR
eukprot:TCONS_00037436-protein